MPKGRMLNKSISYDEELSDLSIESILFFTWCIPHLDVEGRIYANPNILKGLVVPYLDKFKPKLIEKCCKELYEAKFVILYGTKQKYMHFLGFKKNQRIDPEKEAESIIPEPPKETLELLQSNSKVTLPKVKKSKVKKSKVVERDITIIIDYLNKKLNTEFKTTTGQTKNFIKARLKEGYSLDDFKAVIDYKYLQWKGTRWQQYLTPTTLFRPNNFENYLQVSKTEMKRLEKEKGEIL